MIVWSMEIPPDEYVRCITPNYRCYRTRTQLKKFLGGTKGRVVNVGYEVVPSEDKRYMLLLRYFFLYRRDHFFGGEDLRPEEWWSDPSVMPSEGIRVRDIKPLQ